MNEVTLLFYGQPENLNSVLLLNLNIIEFREPNEDYNGLYVQENKFGKEVLRKISTEFKDGDTDWLVYRYLTDEESSLIQNTGSTRRIYVLLQNYMTLEYFKSHVPAGSPSCFYIVGQGEALKPVSAVAQQYSAKNILVAKTVKKKKQTASDSSNLQVPDFMAALLKLVLNPVDEINVISTNLMHSNRRFLYRLVELLKFMHFIIHMTGVVVFRGLGIRIFWKSFATVGFLRVAIIKSGYLIRHVFLSLFYFCWGLAVDSVNLMIRIKDKFVLTVYYRTLQKFYYSYIHAALHAIWLYVLSPFYYRLLRPVLIVVYLWAEKWIYFKGIHRLFYFILKGLGFVWERHLSPGYYRTVHPIIHKKLKPVVSAIYYNGFVWVYFHTIHPLYHKILKPFVLFVFYQSIHRLYHQLLKPVFVFVWVILLQNYLFYGFIHKFYYKVIHRFYFDRIHKGYYELIHRNYYRVNVLVMYRIWPWVKFHIFIRLHHFCVFKVRHYFLMSVFKSYGFGFDIVMLVLRITKLYLMFPIFKIYWFSSFQYEKRIKKYFA